MSNYLQVIPAYGRTYNSKAEVLKDWNKNLDFIIQDIGSGWDSKPINKPQATAYTVKVRYGKRLEKVMFIKP